MLELELLIFNSSLFIFGIILIIISLILLRETIKSEKIARPFITSVFLYFFLLAIANIHQVYHNTINFENILQSMELRLYTTFFVYLLTITAPIYLTYEIEQLFFAEKKIFSKYHIFTFTSLVLYAVYITVMMLEIIRDINFINVFILSQFNLFMVPLIIFQVFFFTIAFLYLAIKTTEKYRRYSLMVSLGWLLNYAVNAIITFPPTIEPILVIILLIPKLLGVIITAIGFYKLYSLKKE